MEFISKTADQTKSLGKAMAKKLVPGDTVAFFGDLGSGKTTFIQGVLEGLGITERVTSPTFVFMKLYKVPEQTVFHIDLYRLEHQDQSKALGIEELLQDHNSIKLIEWPERIEALLPENTKRISFTTANEKERIINADF